MGKTHIKSGRVCLSIISERVSQSSRMFRDVNDGSLGEGVEEKN